MEGVRKKIGKKKRRDQPGGKKDRLNIYIKDGGNTEGISKRKYAG